MRKRDELRDPASCLNKAAEDELLFVVLARDEAAPAAVLAWAAERVKLGLNKPDDPKIDDALKWVADVLIDQARERLRRAQGFST